MLAYGATTAFLALAFNVVVLAYGSTTTFLVLAFLAVLLAYGATAAFLARAFLAVLLADAPLCFRRRFHPQAAEVKSTGPMEA